MAFSDSAKAVIALTTTLGAGKTPPLSPAEWHQFSTALVAAGLLPRDVFAPDFDPALPGVPADLANSVRQLLVSAAAATVAAADLENKGIWTLTITDIEYPPLLTERLGQRTPPVIFGVGPTTLLTRRGIGIVGSPNVSEDGAEVAGDLARAAVVAGHTVVSGGGRGVDKVALNTALSNGGKALAMIADSLQARIRSPDLLRAVASGNTTIVTQQAPGTGGTPESEIARSKLIYAMSDVTVIVASDLESGATWTGATETLATRNGLVAAWCGPGEGPGNGRLVELGAVAIRSPKDLLACVDATSTPVAEQLSLPDGSETAH